MNKHIEEVIQKFKEGHNTNNISDPASDTQWVESFLRSAITESYQEGEKVGMAKAEFEIEHYFQGLMWKEEIPNPIKMQEELLNALKGQLIVLSQGDK